MNTGTFLDACDEVWVYFSKTTYRQLVGRGQRSDLAIPPIGAPESLPRAPLKVALCAIRRTRPEGAP
jgi:hypothetical protein